jgi:hypothetical protein
VTQARRGADYDMVGRAGVALGLFLQHEGRLPEARTVLEEGLAVLDPAHPDALIQSARRSSGAGSASTATPDDRGPRRQWGRLHCWLAELWQV